jgi:hypothetical protein
MRTRLALATALCALLAVSAGCAALGGNAIDPAALNESASYEWDTDATVTYNVTGGEYQAVVNADPNTTVTVYIDTQIEGEQPVSVSALKFRYPNGTVVNASAVGVEDTGNRLVLTPPAAGQLAYTAPAGGKTFQAPAAVNGSYDVVLPRGMRVGAFLFGSVSPGGYETTLDSTGRLTLHWEQLDGGEIHVRYYLQRDVELFLGLLAVLAAIAAGGIVYYRRQIRTLERAREDAEDLK